MPESDLLTVLAEIGLGAAGFAGIVAAVSSQNEPWRAIEKERFRILLYLSFTVVLFALLPLGIHSGLADVAASWRVSSGLLLAVLLSQIPLRLVRSRRMVIEDTEPVSWPLTLMHICIQTLVVGLLVANTASLAAAWPYLAAVGLLLVSTATLFLEMLMLAFPGE